jgi:precorrin-2 methylase
MILLNTTFVLHTSIEAPFLQWVRNVYLPAAEQSGVFGVATVARVLTQIEPDTESIAVQLPCAEMEAAQHWHDDTADLLRDDLHARWGDRLMFFSTYMEVIE